MGNEPKQQILQVVNLAAQLKENTKNIHFW